VELGMSLDYEKEYDNRSRVPEHPQMFVRWAHEGAAYRAAARASEIGLSYGVTPRQVIDIFPAEDNGPPTPLALFIHGGWWRSLDYSLFSQLAAGPNAHGITVAIAGYNFCPQITIAQIIDQMRAACLWLWRRERRRIMVFGHSAGGHLAACMTATEWTTLAPDAPNDLVPCGYAISGVFDLAPLPSLSVNQDLRLDAASARACSPLYWKVPPGRSLDAVVGALESSEFLRQSRAIAQAWRQSMAQTRYGEIPAANHYTVIDPLTDASSAMTARVVELARQTAAASLSHLA
jgi:arylformamidase